MRISDWSSDVCSSDLVDIDVVRRIAHERVTVPGRPQRLGDIDELVSHFIAVGMRGKLVVIVVLRRRRLAGGDNIPARPATAQAVDARQQAREDERRVERRRGRADHDDMEAEERRGGKAWDREDRSRGSRYK